MKLVKNCVFSVLLATVLAVSASAGELDMPGAPKPGVTASDEPKIVAYGDPDATVTTVETSDYLLFEALAALLSVY
jgi:hypothetical protein